MAKEKARLKSAQPKDTSLHSSSLGDDETQPRSLGMNPGLQLPPILVF